MFAHQLSMLLYGTYLWQPNIDSLQMFIAKNKVAFSFEFISRMSMSKSKHQLTKNTEKLKMLQAC